MFKFIIFLKNIGVIHMTKYNSSNNIGQQSVTHNLSPVILYLASASVGPSRTCTVDVNKLFCDQLQCSFHRGSSVKDSWSQKTQLCLNFLIFLKQKTFIKEDQRATKPLKVVVMLLCVIIIIISSTANLYPVLEAQVDRHGNLRQRRSRLDPPTFKKPINSLRHHLSSRIPPTYFNNLLLPETSFTRG